MNALRSFGFTLIELMVTVSIAAIVLTLGVPGYTEMIQNNRMTTQINEFTAYVNLARSEAIKRGVSVTMCKRNTPGTACDNSASWLAGWIVFADPSNKGTIDTGEEVIRLRESLVGLTSINFSTDRLTFGSLGLLEGVLNRTITFCDSRGLDKAKGKVLSRTGRLRDADSSSTLICS
jgi:type IV fimbrial biogenesis protein FimT